MTLLVCTRKYATYPLTIGDVYEAETPSGDNSVYIIADTGKASRFNRDLFRAAGLDDAYTKTHWLDGKITPTGSIGSLPSTPPDLTTKLIELGTKDAEARIASALDTQVGGGHYKKYPIQPIEYAQKNKLGPCEFNVVKYVTRHKDKKGKEDLLKARHMIDILIQLEYPE